MGAGIAQRFVQSGYQVFCVEIEESRAAETTQVVNRNLRRWATKLGRPEAYEAAWSHLQVVVDVPPNVDPELVVETVPEIDSLKRSVLANYSARFRRAILATNTSALSIDDLATSVTGPDRFLGMHFFNPVPVSNLLEVVRGSQTSPDALTSAHRHAHRLSLTPVEVRDSPGFATSRLGIAIGLEAIRMVEEMVASPEEIDTAMVLGYRLPIGPLDLSDRVGLDVRLAIAENLYRRLGERFRPPDLLRSMVLDGLLGAKTGKGFYTWVDGTKVLVASTARQTS